MISQNLMIRTIFRAVKDFSDLTDEEWAVVAPLIPPPRPGGGKRRTTCVGVNGLMYILSTGCQWRYLPKDFPPHSTVYNYFVWWHVSDRAHRAASFHLRCIWALPSGVRLPHSGMC